MSGCWGPPGCPYQPECAEIKRWSEAEGAQKSVDTLPGPFYAHYEMCCWQSSSKSPDIHKNCPFPVSQAVLGMATILGQTVSHRDFSTLGLSVGAIPFLPTSWLLRGICTERLLYGPFSVWGERVFIRSTGKQGFLTAGSLLVSLLELESYRSSPVMEPTKESSLEPGPSLYKALSWNNRMGKRAAPNRVIALCHL